MVKVSSEELYHSLAALSKLIELEKFEESELAAQAFHITLSEFIEEQGSKSQEILVEINAEYNKLVLDLQNIKKETASKIIKMRQNNKGISRYLDVK